MKSLSLPLRLNCLLFASLLTEPSRAGGNDSQQTGTLDAGGARASSANYSQTASVGVLGSRASNAGSNLISKPGFIGQLYEVASLKLSASPATLDEGGTSQVRTTATLDDATLLHLSGGEVKWRVLLGPVEAIDTHGVVKFRNVYQDSFASIEAGYQGRSDGVRFLIRNVGDDDSGIYAHDNIPDLWQVQNFGENNPRGIASADPDGDGQNNFFEYAAGLSPTNAASRFTLEIADLPESAHQKALLLSPRLEGRGYFLESSTDPGAGFAPLTNAEQVDFGTIRLVLDPDASMPHKFYRVKISLP
ncbi:MAG: hypothetical protein DME19_21270 [Verrucomicrobia bacterium]|nr:MAG: hypothetical protein DME19_21270 [Verrucomicrobiota bacterium]